MDSMAIPDIAMLSMVLSQSQVKSDIGTALLADSLNISQTDGQAMVNMINQSLDPNLGQNIDISVWMFLLLKWCLGTTFFVLKT